MTGGELYAEVAKRLSWTKPWGELGKVGQKDYEGRAKGASLIGLTANSAADMIAKGLDWRGK